MALGSSVSTAWPVAGPVIEAPTSAPLPIKCLLAGRPLSCAMLLCPIVSESRSLPRDRAGAMILCVLSLCLWPA